MNLNFTLNKAEIRVRRERLDPLQGFLIHHMETLDFIDIESISFQPTWFNSHAHEVVFSKRLDRFIMSSSILQRV